VEGSASFICDYLRCIYVNLYLIMFDICNTFDKGRTHSLKSENMCVYWV